MQDEDLAEWRPPNPQVADEMPTAEELREEEEEGENRPPSLPEGPERFATGESMKVDDGEIVKAKSSSSSSTSIGEQGRIGGPAAQKEALQGGSSE